MEPKFETQGSENEHPGNVERDFVAMDAERGLVAMNAECDIVAICAESDRFAMIAQMATLEKVQRP